MSQHYSRHYARFHPDTPEHDGHLRRLCARWFGAHLPADRRAAILDVGCGRGYAVAWLRDLGYENVCGIDPDSGQVAFGHARGWPVQHVAATTAFLRERPVHYDLVLLADVLEHVPLAEQNDFLVSIRGALRTGGRLLCTVPNAAAAIGGYWRYNDYTHTSAFTCDSLNLLLEQAGFAVDHIGPVEFFVRPRYLFWLPGRRTLQWWLLALVRLRWRLVYWAELGFERGGQMPLSLNLLGVARRAE